MEQLRLSIVDAALAHVPAHGWSEQALHAALRDTSYSPSIVSLLQPEPAWCLAAHFLTQSTRAACASYRLLALERMSKQQRATRLLSLLLSAHSPYLSRLSSLLGLCYAPSLARHSVPLLAELVDECVHALQDGGTGVEWYGRRAVFAAVWQGGLLHRSVDRSEAGRDSEAWLARRVDEWARGEEAVGELTVLAGMYGSMGYSALLRALAGGR